MFRKWVLPAACAALLGGCVSYGYSDGGYYYGQPSVRYYGGASYGYPYGGYSPYSPYSRYYGGRYGYGYGYPYGYGYGNGYGGHYRYPHYPYYPYYPRRPGGHDHDDRDDDNHQGGKPPWRRAMHTGGNAQRLRDTIRPQHQQPIPAPTRGALARDGDEPQSRMRVEGPPRSFERRESQPQRESAPAARNMRERDVSREQEP